MLKEEVEEAVHSLKAGRSPGIDNIPSELVKNGGEATTMVLTVVCKKVWETKEWPKEWTSPYLYQRKATSSNVRTIEASA